eukprot:8360079-Alexandrium_andersonii.AAC.1
MSASLVGSEMCIRDSSYPKSLDSITGSFYSCPTNLRTVASAGRSGVRTLGPARPRVTLRTQHVPAEPFQRRSTSCSAVPPMQ